MDAHLRHLEKLYDATQSQTIGAQLIRVYLRRGDTPNHLARKFPASLIWDEMQGLEPGRTQSLVLVTTVGLENMLWRADLPESFILGFHGNWRFRCVWPNLEIPYLDANSRMPNSLVLEEEPRLFPEPTLAVSNINVAASGGRLSSFWAHTKRVPLRDISATLRKVDECVYNIYHGGVAGPEQEIYSGLGTLEPDKNPDQGD